MISFERIKKYKNWNIIARAAILAILPAFYSLLRCLIDGKGIGSVYLPASTWNDELFYYKLTEGVVHHGYPQGFFGFNESHGMHLSFAAWSPLLLLFWVLWGLLFGWNLLSPYLSNMVFLGIALFLFGIWTKPDKKQILFIGLFYGAFTPITRFTLSCMPEAEIYALFILFVGLAIGCRKNYDRKKIFAMLILVMLMTWMRPYLILLFLTPLVLWKAATWLKGIITAALGGFTLAVYVAVNHYLSAPYFTDLFYTDWIKAYFDNGFFAGIKYTLWKLKDSLLKVWEWIRLNVFTNGEQYHAAGCYYAIFLILLGAIAVRIIAAKGKNVMLELHMFLYMMAFLAADLLMYRIQEGGRHTLVFIVGCIFLIPFWEKKERYIASGMVMLLFLFVFAIRMDVPNETEIPYQDSDYAADIHSLEGQLKDHMKLVNDAPSFENTIIWTLSDTVGDKTQVTNFGSYYAVPKGFGINLCNEEFLNENIEHLQSRYVGTIPDGNLEQKCIDAGGKKIGESERLVVYDMKRSE